jgi:hypothetical protein
MKKTFFLVIAATLFATQLKAYDFEAVNADGISIFYNLSSDGKSAVVTYYNSPTGYRGDIVIPDEVIYNGKSYPVTSIGHSAFSANKYLTGIVIPSSIASIGYDAFKNCDKLTNVTIQAGGLTSIGADAFAGCSSLESITIPSSVTSIGASVFRSSGLTDIPITDGVTAIPDYAYTNCAKLTHVTIPGNITSIGIAAFTDSNLTSVTIPNSVTSIGNDAFSGSNLTSVTIPNSVTSIGQYAFHDLNLISVTIPSSVTSIGGCAFSCLSLREFVVSGQNNHFSTIDGVLFNKDKSVLVAYPNAKASEYTIPNVLSIGYCAFKSCDSLKSVTIPNSVLFIGDEAFWGCDNLKSVTIPNSVLSIGVGAFAYCDGFTEITIPHSVISIGEAAFYFCDITSVTIGKNVSSIGKGAFYFCNKLVEVHNNSSVPQTIDMYVFFHISSEPKPKLYVPRGCSDAYKTTSRWHNVFGENIFEEDVVSLDIVDTKLSSLQIFPNPASDFVTVSGLQGNKTLYFYNATGNMLLTRHVTGGTENIPVGHLPSGLYFVKVNNGQILKWLKK